MEGKMHKGTKAIGTYRKQESAVDLAGPEPEFAENSSQESGFAAKRTAKDSVFCDLFRDKKYLLQLYQALHPEDTKTTEADLTDITIRNVLTDGIYNDVGFRNRNKVIFLVEAQSS